MKSIVRWAIDNTPAMNTLLVAGLLVGLFSLLNLRREVFPEFDLEIILVTVPYPGASPEEVEDGICQKIEEAVRALDGIKKQTAVAKEGAGSLVLELKTGVDAQRILSEVRSEIDRIPSFPLLAEDPEVKQITMRQPAIQVGVRGPEVNEPEAERQLRDLTEKIRDEIVRLDNVSQANVSGARQYQIDVEIPEKTLRRYGLTLQRVAQILRRENFEMPGGTIRTESQEVLVKGDNKRITGEEIARLPLVTLPGGAVLTVGELGTVHDDFADAISATRVDGRPAMVVSVDATSSEDLLAMTNSVNEYVKQRNASMPAGFDLVVWGDRSIEVRDRMQLLARNGMQGLLLVLLVLAVFLNLRVAFWVATGIPVSILGACAVLWITGNTLNMLTMFAFLMALGIVVDDAIVIGENIFAHRQEGKSPVEAAIDGTWEVLPSVIASVGTTVIAFMPLFFVAGVMGKFIAVMPLAMIAMLVISLLESMFVLPCHLAHESHDMLASVGNLRDRMSPTFRLLVGWPMYAAVWMLWQIFYPLRKLPAASRWVNRHSNRLLDSFAERFYLPGLQFAMRRPAVVVAGACSLLMFAVALVRGGHVPFNVFPKLDSNTIEATLIYPDGTPAHVALEATLALEAAIRTANEEYTQAGSPVLRLTRRTIGYTQSSRDPVQGMGGSGSHLGGVTAELLDTTERSVKSDKIITRWRELAKANLPPGYESLKFGSGFGGPGGKAVEFKLLAKAEDVAELEAAVEKVKEKLATYPGVVDIDDDSHPGKWEMKLRVKDKAVAMGVPLGDVAETVRASYYGEEVMRLQRGRHEVKLMVRYPSADRRSLADFDQIRVRAGDGAERPLTEMVDVEPYRGLSEINRVNQMRSITISADVNEAKGNAYNTVADLRGLPPPPIKRLINYFTGQQPPASFMDELQKEYPAIHVRWEGQQEQTQESISSMFIGLGVALLAMFILLTVEFRSYFQPVLIMFIIPFGIVGAIGGHWLLGMPLTLFSMFGLVALTGVVVNDSIVLIDFINHRIRDGLPLSEALLDAGRRRLRPVLLTSLTTIAGLLPLLLERSFQAQILIPMAVSLAFGLMLATVLVLYLVPTFYSIYGRLIGISDDAVPPDDDDIVPRREKIDHELPAEAVA